MKFSCLSRSAVFMMALWSLSGVAAAGGYAVSSEKPMGRDGSSYGAASALDGDAATAWVVHPEQDNVGSWIEIGVPKGKVDKLSLVVGWAADESTFKDYSRLAEARVLVKDSAQGDKVVLDKVLTFQDQMGRQTLDLSDVEVGDDMVGGVVRIEVTKVIDGVDFSQLAVSEALVHMGEFDAPLLASGSPSSQADGHLAAALIDADLKTYWAATGEAPQTVEVKGGRFGLSSLGVVVGPATQSRPKTIRITQSGVTRTYTCEDKQGLVQWFELPALVGYTGSGDGPVSIEIVDTYPGASPAPAISELKARATTLSPF
jgi:hypothetical protein